MRPWLAICLTALSLNAFSASLLANGNDAEDFLEWLALTVAAPVEDVVPDLGSPGPISLACSVSRDCGDGNSLACTGNFSCHYSLQGVNCDNTNHPCPNFCSLGWRCGECPGYSFFCFSTYGDCGITNSGCAGEPQVCACPDVP